MLLNLQQENGPLAQKSQLTIANVASTQLFSSPLARFFCLLGTTIG